MQKWVVHYGVMSAILNDNGGEFTGAEMIELKNTLNVIDLTTDAESPWQNGLCEKNHALVDNILNRIHKDYPRMDMNTKIAWACMAKNSLQMVYGYSPNQLVFGRNPNLQNIITAGPPSWEEDMNSVIAKHLHAMNSACKAFIQSESCSKLKLALKSKIRTNEDVYDHGDVVYYKRECDDKWIGPAKVVFQDGKVIFVRHGAYFVRVSANRLIKAGEELSKRVNAKENLDQIKGDQTDHPSGDHSKDLNGDQIKDLSGDQLKNLTTDSLSKDYNLKENDKRREERGRLTIEEIENNDLTKDQNCLNIPKDSNNATTNQLVDERMKSKKPSDKILLQKNDKI